ncbi:MAG: hypothetical protein A4E45_00786 [Methanosaeta sp. PtaB.Bin039]|nr:MAG: hypothetical protein A4E45_00786 [Methanosaeta sp. PtaB.Bin039]OPY44374.1 MAG: hypothetical protein A4E47_01607 [Methanosaeta sp. PtaU1.Bin028]HOT06238.1 hypothetical protein [Methanotrichaceae archaeon]HQF15452.1 hypothetical protein [Methanotrichaceae archaeon]HQI90187.1 hypothetical protein [Methanotrichaceae archaeon]
MIIRIMGEGQFSVSSSLIGKLNEIDNRIVEKVCSGDKEGYAQELARLIAMVKSEGEIMQSREIISSDLIIPPPDMTLEEAQRIFKDDGLIAD